MGLGVLLFQVSQVGILFGFLIFGMDIRRRKNVISVVQNNYILLMKFSCFVLLLFFLWSIWMVKTVSVAQIACLCLTGMGVGLIAWAKLSLGQNFSWTGYQVKNMEIVTHGPYRYVKHPLYYGVFMVEAGAVVNYFAVFFPLEHLAFRIIIPTVALGYALAFNMIMAKKETRNINRIKKMVE